MEGAILVLFVCGLIAGAIYRGKGKKMWVGFLAGFIFGIIGIIFTAVAKTSVEGQAKQQRKDEEKLIRGGTHKRCEHCDDIISAKATICKHCGEATT
jgi:uncharacterized membrane protein YeaQ/YmgE (transglycosylase-associated protein family)